MHIMNDAKHRIGIFSGSRFPIDEDVKRELVGGLMEIARMLDPKKHTVVYGGRSQWPDERDS